jgi:hypothetical protein
MDSGWAAVLGSAVGGMGTFAATWLNAHLSRKKPDPAEEAAKRLLKELLEQPFWDWRHIRTLANVVGTDEPTVRRLLLEIGARGSTQSGEMWGLVSRNPMKKWIDDNSPQDAADELQERWKNTPPSN